MSSRFLERVCVTIANFVQLVKPCGSILILMGKLKGREVKCGCLFTHFPSHLCQSLSSPNILCKRQFSKSMNASLKTTVSRFRSNFEGGQPFALSANNGRHGDMIIGQLCLASGMKHGMDARLISSYGRGDSGARIPTVPHRYSQNASTISHGRSCAIQRHSPINA